jgi:hypothetical protein
MRRFAPALVLAIAASPAGAETIAIDANADRHAISPLIYGVAFGDAASLADLGCPLDRHGGNTTTRYNWQVNASNRAADWYFESIADGPATAGAAADDFITTARTGGAQPMITVPMIGWGATVGSGRAKLCSFSVAKYGPQAATDAQWYPDAGNGVKAAGGNVTGNDPNDANAPVDVNFQKSWVQHLVATWGASSAGGVGWYLLDNEHSIWHSTHRDVHPTGAGMDEIGQKMVDYATMIKSVDPGARVLGPEEWGWSGFLYSGADQQYGAAHGWGSLPDRAAHGNMDYVPWLLAHMKSASDAAGKRLLDVCSVHWYPQGGEFGNDTSAAMQAKRNRSTRSLWDPAYVDESWIGTQVQLIPRLKSWVAAYYPGTAIGLTEYNWGAEGDINGGTAQADILGILGREGCDVATRWTSPAAGTPVYLAMKMYSNYDGGHSRFGDTSVRATVANPDDLAAFAAVRGSDGALTVMLVNKVASAASVTLALSNFSAGTLAQAWQLTSSNAISHLADLPVAAGQLTTSVPAQSVTLVVVQHAGGGTSTGGTTTGGSSTGSGTGSGGTTGSTSTGGSGTTGAASTGASGGAGPVGGPGGSGSSGCGFGSLGALALVALAARTRKA